MVKAHLGGHRDVRSSISRVAQAPNSRYVQRPNKEICIRLGRATNHERINVPTNSVLVSYLIRHESSPTLIKYRSAHLGSVSSDIAHSGHRDGLRSVCSWAFPDQKRWLHSVRIAKTHAATPRDGNTNVAFPECLIGHQAKRTCGGRKGFVTKRLTINTL